MMKIKTRKKNKLNRRAVIILISTAAVLTILGIVLYFYVFKNSTPQEQNQAQQSEQVETDLNLNPPTDEEVNAGNLIKENSVNNSPSAQNDNISLIITSANQVDNTLSVRTLIEGVVSSGSCTLELISGNKKVTKFSEVQALSNSSTCKGFDVPVSELSTGTWQINLTYQNSNQRGSTTGSVEVSV